MPERRITSDDIAREILGIVAPFKKRISVTARSSAFSSGGGGGVVVTGMTNPMTTAADIIVGGESGAPRRLGVGASGQVLTVVGGLVQWADSTGGGGGASLLDELTDVDDTAKLDGYVLTYDSTSGLWIAAESTGTPGPPGDDGATGPAGPTGPAGAISINWTIKEGGVPSTGLFAVYHLPAEVTIVDWVLVSADGTTGSIQLDLQTSDYSGLTTFSSIIGAGIKPSLSASTKARMSSLASWTTALPADTFLALYIDSASDLSFVTFALTVERTP